MGSHESKGCKLSQAFKGFGAFHGCRSYCLRLMAGGHRCHGYVVLQVPRAYRGLGVDGSRSASLLLRHFVSRMVSQSSKREWLMMTRKGPWKERERSLGTRGGWRGGGWGDCSSLITLQWLSFGYQFPWWFVYFLPPWGLRLSEIFLGYIFNVSQLNNAISLLSSLVRRLHLIYAWYARKSSSADWRTTTWQWNLEIVCQYEVSLYFCFLINYWRKKVVLYTEEFG